VKRLVLEALLRIKREGPLLRADGICHNVLYLMPPHIRRQGLNAFQRVLVDLYRSWEHFTGDDYFPVEGDELEPWSCCDRLHLLHYMIDTLTEELDYAEH